MLEIPETFRFICVFRASVGVWLFSGVWKKELFASRAGKFIIFRISGDAELSFLGTRMAEK